MPTARARGDVAAALARSIAEEAGSADAALVGEAARLGEVGKLYVSAEYLFARRSALDEKGRAALASHFEHGHALARGAGVPDRACAWILNARERWDGGGPTGLAAADIPFGSRVLAIAQSYLDAPLLAEGEGEEEDPRAGALRVLAGLSGTALDPELTEIALRLAAAPRDYSVREAAAGDRDALGAFLEKNHSARVARAGEMVNPLDHPILIAEQGGELAGALTWIPGDPAEILTLHAATRYAGVGTALIDAVVERVAAAGGTRIRVTTTNDNVDALRFYQRRGFRLRELRAGAVESSRARLKPEIPTTGEHGIYIRDEIELERDV